MDMETILKVCRVCNEAKPEHCYYVASRRCRACVSKINTEKNKDYMKEYYKSKKEELNAKSKKLYSEVYKPLREKMYESYGLDIKKVGRQQKHFKPENSTEIKNI
jgi:hypothetical protein